MRLTKNAHELISTVVRPGLILYTFENMSPAARESEESAMLITMKPLKEFAMFFAVTAGTIRSALIRSTPTKLTPTAMVKAMRMRRKSSMRDCDTRAAVERSGAMAESASGFK